MASSPIQIGPPTRLSKGGGTVVINSSGAITLTPNSGQALTFATPPTLTGFTAGSVLFAGTAGLVSQDNAGFSFNATTDVASLAGAVAVGTNPASAGAVRLANAAYVNWRDAGNSADLSGWRANASDYLDFGTAIYRDEYAIYDSPKAWLNLRRAFITAPTAGERDAVARFAFQTKQSGTGDQGRVAGYFLGEDRSDVTNKTVTNVTRSGTTATVTATSHGYATGDRISLYGVTHTFNAEVNGVWTIANALANTFDITVAGLSSGSYTSGGTATNRGLIYPVLALVGPVVARGGLTGTAEFGDDANCFIALNVGTAKATDMFYGGHNAASFTGASEFATLLTFDANADYGIRLNGRLVNGCFDLYDATVVAGGFYHRTPLDWWGAGGLGLGTQSPAYGIHALGGSMKIQALATPGAPTVTPQGTTGATTYTYYVVALDRAGYKTLKSANASTATGNATLSGSNFNRITWSAVPGAVSYDVIRSVGGASQGSIALATTALTVDDTGLAASAYSAPARNATADLVVGGGLTVTTDFDANGALKITDGTNNKFVRMDSTDLELLNSAYNAVILTLSDTGTLTLNAAIAAAGTTARAPLKLTSGTNLTTARRRGGRVRRGGVLQHGGHDERAAGVGRLELLPADGIGHRHHHDRRLLRGQFRDPAGRQRRLRDRVGLLLLAGDGRHATWTITTATTNLANLTGSTSAPRSAASPRWGRRRRPPSTSPIIASTAFPVTGTEATPPLTASASGCLADGRERREQRPAAADDECRHGHAAD
jgi:hypothetical protein